MLKHSKSAVFMAAAATLAIALPGAAQAGDRRGDCLDRMARDIDRSMTRIVHHVDRTFKDMFRWCDRRHRR